MIRVLVNFGGRNTNERRIEPGLYHDDDARLLGVGAYLVANGFAVLVPDEDLPPMTTTVVRGAVVLLPETPVATTKEYTYEPVKETEPVTLTTAPGGEVVIVDDAVVEDEPLITDVMLNEGESSADEREQHTGGVTLPMGGEGGATWDASEDDEPPADPAEDKPKKRK